MQTLIDQTTITDAEKRLDEFRLLRVSIFDDTPNGKLTKKDQAVFWYREERRQQWKLVKDEVVMNEVEWNARYDQQRLEKLQLA